MTAQMLPLAITKYNTPTEQDVYNLLQSKLPDEYTVLYSRRWKSDGSTDHTDVECDFIVTRPGAPILILEVKGGLWERVNGKWLCYKKPVEEKDNPFIQAIQNKDALIKLLRRGKWDNTYFPVDYAIVLPETEFAKVDMVGMPAILTCTQMDYIEIWIEEIIQQYIQRNFNPNHKMSLVTQEMLDYLKLTLMRDYVIRLNEILLIDDHKLAVFTQQQLELEKNLVNKHRITAQGCAGSGKTLLAIRQVRRLARKPDVRKIFFTCFNRELGKWLKKNTEDIKNRCETVPFLDFCEYYALEAQVITAKDKADPEYYDKLPFYFLEANNKLGLSFDAIVVDEGQSFKDEWWEVLESMLVDKKKSYLYIFYDDFQRIYQEVKNNVPGDDEPFELAFNLRNTAVIHNYATKFLPKEGLPECNNVKGEPVWIHFYGRAQLMKVLKKVLNQLIKVGGVSAKDIIILTPKSKTSIYQPKTTIGPFQLLSLRDQPIHVPERPTNGTFYQKISSKTYEMLEMKAPDEDGEDEAYKKGSTASVHYSSIQYFRGMEKKVVIMTEIDNENLAEYRTLHYLGCSRAKTQLVMLVSEDLDDDLKQQLLEGAEDKTGLFDSNQQQ